MTDEEFLFVSDCADKKRTARGIHNKRTHTGKGGKVRFPSDNLSRKELDAMNGEVITYSLNKPMKWDEYKRMPDDLRRQYIENLQKRYDIMKKDLVGLFGVSASSVELETKKLGIHFKRRGYAINNNNGAWRDFCAGLKAPEENEPEAAPHLIDEPQPDTAPEKESEETPVAEIRAEKPKAVACSFGEIPEAGSLTFTGNVADILKTVGLVLSGGNVHMEINWTRVKGCVENG